MKLFSSRNFLFWGCLLFSIVIHGGVLYFLFNTPLFLHHKWNSFWFNSSNEPEFLATERNEKLVEKVNHALEESFSHIIAAGQLAKQKEYARIIKETSPKEKIFLTSDENTPFEKSLDFFSYAPDPSFSGEVVEEEFFDKQETESFESHDLIDEFSTIGTRPKEPVVDDFSIGEPVSSIHARPAKKPAEIQNELTEFLKKNYETDDLNEESLGASEIAKDHIPTVPPLYLHTKPVDSLRDAWTSKSIIERKVHDIEYYGFTDIANYILWEDEIKVDVSYIPDPEGKKYIFSLTLHPDFDINAEPLQQNFYFIIDHSGSIKKSRFNAQKRAVQRALSGLQEGDKFNIVILDREISRLSEKNLFFSPKNVKLAEEFLERENYKPSFSSDDLYQSLEHLFPLASSSEEINSAILVSDGNALLGGAKQKKALLSWVQKYKGKVNFYTAASGQGNNLVLLDLISYTTSGKLLYSDTHASFPRKLVKLVQDLHHPILKEVTIDAVAQDPNNKLSLYPSKVLLPPFYLKKPVTLVGTIEDLDDFTLYIQGKNRGRWMNVKKTITFKDSVKGGRSLEKTWAYTKANFCYDRFVKEGKNGHLAEAKKILAPYKAVICQE